MKRLKLFDLAWLESSIPWAMLAVLGTLTYALFFQVTYAGFSVSSNSIISQVYVTVPPDQTLKAGDHLLRVDLLTWDDFRRDLQRPLFNGVQPGDVIHLVVERDGEQRNIDWTFPGPTPQEVWARLSIEEWGEFGIWQLAYFFWLAGTVTLLFSRPKDDRWRLLIAFNFLTALWLAVGGTLYPRHVWGGAFIFRIAAWLSVPVYWHLHWVFPAPLRKLPPVFWWALYGLAMVLALLECLQWTPNGFYFFGFLLAMVGSEGLLVAHLILQPDQRRNVGLLVFAIMLVLGPAIAVLIVGIFTSLPANAALTLLTFPILPFGYWYIAYRRQLSGLELRANRLITSYIFFIVLGMGMVIFIALADSLLDFPGKAATIGILATLITATLTTISLAPFQRFVERWLLGIRLPPAHLLEAYPARITVSLDTLTLVHLLTDEILPSLLIRQSALLHLEEGRLLTCYANGVDLRQLPTIAELPTLLAQAGHYRAPTEEVSQPYAWIRLILPLEIEKKTMGLWLLGRRDPDDFYSQSEIPILKALADQTAIALTNITYAKRLHALYQTSIDQREAERASLGHELHDQILHKMFLIQEKVASMNSPSFTKEYKAVIHDLRDLIRGLRPPMLEYGLYRALVALTDDWNYQSKAQSGPIISLKVPETDMRYFPHVEQHIYRIIQQAGENALRHARARTIKISGCLKPDLADLTIEDDGVGFEVQKMLDLSQPEARSHFGLIGMRERAALINAQIKFDSALSQGTRVRVIWNPE